jgi:hypothetical protein
MRPAGSGEWERWKGSKGTRSITQWRGSSWFLHLRPAGSGEWERWKGAKGTPRNRHFLFRPRRWSQNTTEFLRPAGSGKRERWERSKETPWNRRFPFRPRRWSQNTTEFLRPAGLEEWEPTEDSPLPTPSLAPLKAGAPCKTA